VAFDGINFRGQSLKIRRPHDYQPTPGIDPVAPLGTQISLSAAGVSTKSLTLLTKYSSEVYQTI